MPKDINIRKGLDIKLVGEAAQSTTDATRSNVYAIKPSDFHGVIPKVLAKQGTEIKAGEPLFHSKTNESILFPSPVSGEVVEIVRGAKRKILALKILADKEQEYVNHGQQDVASMSGTEIKTHLLTSGCWPFIKQRPYDVIANPEVAPKAIFISGYDSAPLAANLDYILKGKEKELQTAITALSKLTAGNTYVATHKKGNSPLNGVSGVQKTTVSGPHPVGNVSTHIAKTEPLNKGEVIWTIAAADLVIIGELLLTGKFNAERIVALGGSGVKNAQYYKTKIGAEVATVVYASGVNIENIRVISGNVLTGDNVKPDGHLGYYHTAINVIPEGNDYEFFGWNKPIFNKISPSRALTFSWLFPNKKYDLNTNTNGEHRAFVMTGNYEKVFPLDIYPLQILKACAVNDLDAMEQLGMYEVAPEDFALTEFICVSKQPHQEIIREGLDLMLKEIG